MGITINTNTQSLFAQRTLRKNTATMKASLEKLSTGSRINRAGDDSAGLSIAQKSTTLIRGMDQAQRNIGDGLAMISTIDGALAVVQDNLQRIRELTVQAANGTNGNDEKDAIQREINERVTAINDMGKNATFNGVSLLQSTTDITLQNGANDGNQLILQTASGVSNSANRGFYIDFSSTGSGSLGEGAIALSTFTVGSASVKTLSGTTSATATATALSKLDVMIKNVSRMRSQSGAYENALSSSMEYLDKYSESVQGARSRVQDVDVASESAEQILQQTAAAMLGQANVSPQLALNLLP
ncbi:MAG: flagellin FliC [Proteobacteria bacterium]|nr:flagellin FliC [Pseudomonadota bacterium]